MTKLLYKQRKYGGRERRIHAERVEYRQRKKVGGGSALKQEAL